MALTFYWHDYETAGLDTRRDAPTQFAGLRTTADLQPIGEPLMLYCRPPRDALPSPAACLVTRTTPQQCEAKGVSEAHFVERIAAEFETPDTVALGYNSFGFDDHVTRHLLWRTLRDPYAREWQNGCSRWDLLPVVRCVYALRPQALQWPTDPDGRVSFKLERLAQANGLAHDQAHDALSDVRATLALAQKIRAEVPRLWDYCLRLRSKAEVQKIVSPLGTARQPFLHVSGRLPQERGHLGVMWPLAPHPHHPNEVLVWDLSEDPRELLALDAQAVRHRLFTRSDDLPDGVRRLPIKTLRINQSPVVVVPLQTLRPDRAQALGIDLAACEAHAEAALAQAAAFDAWDWSAVFDRPPAEPGLDAELTLYSGAFLSRDDRSRLQRLLQKPPAQWAQAQLRFDDARLEELAFRYRARNWPETLNGEEAAQWEAHRHRRLHEGASGFRTLQQFADEIDALAEQVQSTQDEALLEALVDWAEALA